MVADTGVGTHRHLANLRHPVCHVHSLWRLSLCPHALHRGLQFSLKSAVPPELLAYIF
jgi:hypothetical protein